MGIADGYANTANSRHLAHSHIGPPGTLSICAPVSHIDPIPHLVGSHIGPISRGMLDDLAITPNALIKLGFADCMKRIQAGRR